MNRLIKLLAIVLTLAAAVAATTVLAQAKGGVVRGRVTDEGGRPVAGATVTATYQSYGGGALQYGGRYNRQATSGADGRYAIALNGLPPGEYSASASWKSVDLIPENDANFASNAQTVRNFRYAVVERTADSEYGNGGMVAIENEIGDYETNLADVVVTATPRNGGPAITRPVRQTGEGWIITGLPFGAYTVSATYNGRPMRVKLWGSQHFNDPFVASVGGSVDSSKRVLRIGVKR